MCSDKNLLYAQDLCKTFYEIAQPSHYLANAAQKLWPSFSKQLADPKAIEVLKNVNLELNAGEIVGIIGGNGAGKTTLLRVLSGITPNTSGVLETRGKICPVLDLGFGLIDDISGRENIYFVGALRGYTRRDMSDRVSDIEAFASIGAAIHEPIKHYSTGMKMRLAYAISTHLDPDIMIIDEALAVGDEGFQHKCFEHLRKLSERGVGIIFVSHSSQAIQELCHRAVLLDQGSVLESGEPSKVIESYHRLLFAPGENQEAVRLSIRNGDRETASDFTTSEVQTSALFDESLTAEAIIYPEQGATISNIKILDMDKNKVNVLTSRQTYIYQFEVAFTRSFDQIRFGMLIKGLTGFELGGCETANQRIQAAVGENIKVEFKFFCHLNPGSYFLNAGVLAPVDGEEVFLARVIDAMQFKVQPNSYHQTGIVDFAIEAKITSSEDND